MAINNVQFDQDAFETSAAAFCDAFERMSGHCQTLIDLLKERDTRPGRIDGVFMATHLSEVAAWLRLGRIYSPPFSRATTSDLLATTEAILRGDHGVL